jgi:IS30 family transposase
MSYRHLTLNERYVIHHLVLYGLSCREIARRLGRHHGTIDREISRNGPRHDGWVYVHEVAQRRADERAHWPRCRRRRDDPRLYRYVVTGLEADWSPEQIAGRLRRDYPANLRMRVCPETIYQWVYCDATQGGGLF